MAAKEDDGMGMTAKRVGGTVVFSLFDPNALKRRRIGEFLRPCT